MFQQTLTGFFPNFQVDLSLYISALYECNLFVCTFQKKTKPAKNAATSVQKKKTESRKKNSKNDSEKSNASRQSTTDQNSQEILVRSSSSTSVNRNSSVDEESQSEEESQSNNSVTPFVKNPSGASIEKGEEASAQTDDNILKTKNRRPRRSGSKVNYDEAANDAELESEEDDWKEEMGDEDGLESTSSDEESESEGRDSEKRKRRKRFDSFKPMQICLLHLIRLTTIFHSVKLRMVT